MRLPRKVEKAYNCLMDYRERCDSEARKVFIDIFTPMFFQENHHSLKINVGKQVRSSFLSWLTSTIDNFNVVLAEHNNEPMFIIRDCKGLNSYISINLSQMSNLRIEQMGNEMVGMRYIIEFTYNDEIDYQMFVVLSKD